MKFEMTRCNQCGGEMLMGVTVCPSCGKMQSAGGQSALFQPRTLMAVVLAAAVLFFFSWIKSPAPQMGAITSPPSAALPSR